MLEALNRALDLVEEDTSRPVDVARMARAALTSEHHLRRMFTSLAGMPLSEYVRRRRLTLAAVEVAQGDATLLDIAVRYGYGSAEAFARAFRALHGVGPGQARRTGAVLTSQPRMTFRLTVEGGTAVRYRIVEKEAFRLVGYRARVPLVHEGVNPDMDAFVRGLGETAWERLAALSDGEPGGVVSAVDNIEPERAEGSLLDYYQAAVSTAPAPEGMDVLEVAAGTWVVFPFEDAPFPEGIQRVWVDAYGQWFPSHPTHRTAPGPELVTADYGEDGSTASGEVWVPVERV
ncbi:AraC family transcriptional regulator [Nocardiopsis changdeensis]|uniref:AraC family transcriptional regulator n=1 Tax=Nocardiopsis changdeensis TaxID=2831969 RepID=A0ABX8BUP7_9ACTN|nr:MULTISPECIES: AraC family transcriptional regulator [Nocardiopsis]QUX25638.1 AraC family transcriptional regulator [Nocardiopsis changdeensis]QYX36025.1 AraC family transcriptional regulator [Nocardiopsis sp. MT53]